MQVQTVSACLDVEGKRVLSNISVVVQPKRVMAIMGPTGSGKTSLLSVLGHRVNVSDGSVLYNGQPWTAALKRQVAFVEQDDEVFPTLTVRQSLMFSARLRLASSLGQDRIAEIVDGAIAALHLEKCANTRIGDASCRGVSGGERKRLCIATELLARPAMLLCDEGTSGLDSAIALTVVTNLRELAQTQGVAVAMSVHQPSSQLFRLFDDLLVLADGNVVYYGPAREVSGYFAQQGLPCPPHYNPPDFLLELIVGQQLAPALPAIERDFRQTNKGTETGSLEITCDLERSKDNSNNSNSSSSNNISNSNTTEYVNGVWHQLRVLLHRTVVLAWASNITLQNAVLYLGLAVVSGLLFVDLRNSEEDIFSRLCVLFFILITWTWFPLFASISIFHDKRAIIKQELSVGAYSMFSYFVARTTAELLLQLFWACAYTTCLWAMTHPSDRAGVFFAVLSVTFLNVLAQQSLGLLMAAAIKQSRVITCLVLLVTFDMVFSNVFRPLEALPGWLQWLQYANPLMYGMQLTLRTVFEGRAFACAAVGSQFVDACSNTTASAQFITSEDIYAKYNVHVASWMCGLVLVAMACVFRVLAMWAYRRDMALTVDQVSHQGLAR